LHVQSWNSLICREKGHSMYLRTKSLILARSIGIAPLLPQHLDLVRRALRLAWINVCWFLMEVEGKSCNFHHEQSQGNKWLNLEGLYFYILFFEKYCWVF
jgi:hypothetical protein